MTISNEGFLEFEVGSGLRLMSFSTSYSESSAEARMRSNRGTSGLNGGRIFGLLNLNRHSRHRQMTRGDIIAWMSES